MILRVVAVITAGMLTIASAQAATTVTGVIPAGDGSAPLSLVMPGFDAGNQLRFAFDFSGGELQAAILTSDGEYRYLNWEQVGVEDDGTPIWFLNGNEASIYNECIVTASADCSTPFSTMSTQARRIIGSVTYSRGYNFCSLGPDIYPGVCAEQTNSLINRLDVYLASGTDVNFSLSYDITAVPEPATWTMMIAGVGMMGGALRRRRGNTKVWIASTAQSSEIPLNRPGGGSNALL
jgi:hypothetical protein